jgi:quercetin dioxygenase-like cupin family protein
MLTKLKEVLAMKKRYWRLFSDQQGESHAEAIDGDLQLTDYAPPAPPVYASRPTAAAGFVFVVAPTATVGDFHPTPGRQLQVVLRGEVEAETSDGTVIRGQPGDVFMLEDTHGRGHRSTVVGDQPLEILAVSLP